MATKTQQKWTENQLKLMAFVARGKKNKKGERRTMEQFAQAIGVDRATLYRWMAEPGWKQEMFEMSIREDLDKLPTIKQAVIGKSLGLKDFKKVDIPAANLAVKLFGVTTDRVEQKVDGSMELSGHLDVSVTNMTDDELDKLLEEGVNNG